MNPAAEVKKPLRARKTMAQGSQKQQAGYLKQLRKAQAEAFSRETLSHVKAAGRDPRFQKELGLAPGPEQKPPRPSREPVASLEVNSEISIYGDRPEVLQDLPYDLSVANMEAKQILNAGAFQDILCRLYAKHPSSPSEKPVEVHSDSEPADQILDRLLLPSSLSQIPSSDASADPLGEILVHFPLPVLQLEENLSQVPKTDAVPVGLSGNVERRRAASGSGGAAHSKRLKISGEAAKGRSPAVDKAQCGLGKIKCFIQNQLDISMRKLDDQLQKLNERLGHTQCLRKHERIAVRIVKKISRLDRHISDAISLQKAELFRKANHLGAHPQNEDLNCTVPLPGTADARLAPSNKPAPNASKALPAASERLGNADEILCLDELEEDSGVLDSGAPGHLPKATAGSPELATEKSSRSQNVALIDLTDEGNLTNSGKEEEEEPILRRRTAGQERLLGNLPQPAQQPPNLVPARFSHLPPLPSSQPSPVQSQGLRETDTLPPQKLELAVAQVSQPKGIALQWNISRVDPRCAPIESFSLFICLEDASSGIISSWRKTNVIKALPLPMACSLSRFPSTARCYFTMQSKDIHGRYGPFCEIQAISAL